MSFLTDLNPDTLRERLEQAVADGRAPAEALGQYDAAVEDGRIAAAFAVDQSKLPDLPPEVGAQLAANGSLPQQSAPAEVVTPPATPTVTATATSPEMHFLADYIAEKHAAPDAAEQIVVDGYSDPYAGEDVDGYSDPSEDTPEEWERLRTRPAHDETTAQQADTSILAEAERIVNGSRAQDYGENSLPHIAAMWSAYLGTEVTGRMVGWMLAQMKMVRDLHKPKRDNPVDVAGYAHLVDDCPTP